MSNYEIQHGLATAQGIAITARAASKMKWCDEAVSERIIAALNKNNLPVVCNKFRAKEIAQSIKKSWGEIIDMVVPVEIGKCEVKKINSDDIESIISEGMR